MTSPGMGPAAVLAIAVLAAGPAVARAQTPSAPPLAEFGESVAVMAGTIVVAGHAGTSLGGAIHVFERRSSSWVAVAVLAVPEARVGDPFGISMAADGNTIVVGAQFADIGATDAGLAYVFERRDGQWRQAAILTARDGRADDQFGNTVSASGDTIVVGARLHDDPGRDAGAAYVFKRRGVAWEQIAKLTASGQAAGDLFGRASLDGDTLIISADLNDDRGSAAGKAYVLRRRDGRWTETAILHASDGVAGDELGISLALSGRTAAFGAVGRDGAVADAGAVYVFEDENGRWTEKARLMANDATPSQAFGLSVAADDDTIVVGAPYHEMRAERVGAAYVFQRDGGRWAQTAKLTASSPLPRQGFGSTVAISAGTIVVGVRGSANGRDPGGAFVFERRDGRWSEVAKLVRPTP